MTVKERSLLGNPRGALHGLRCSMLVPSVVRRKHSRVSAAQPVLVDTKDEEQPKSGYSSQRMTSS